MTLEEVRKEIDAIDLQIQQLLMQRMDCSLQAAQAKLAAGEPTVFRADREASMLKNLGEGVPADRRVAYLAVVKKILETSRMYQYELLYSEMAVDLSPYFKDAATQENGSHVCVRLTRSDTPNSIAPILCMIGDHGYNLEKSGLVSRDAAAKTATFELTFSGLLTDENLKRLLFQLSKESMDFSILNCF